MQSEIIISIVENDGAVREATKSLVQSLGYYAVPFSSVAEFLSSNLVAETSCLICDVQTCGLDPFALHNRLLSIGHPKPIIFISALDDDNASAPMSGAKQINFLLTKPLDTQSLVWCLTNALQGYSGG